MLHSHRIVVIYDGIENSVFISQVLYPLQAWLAVDAHRTATLISFEKTRVTNHSHYVQLKKIVRINVIIRKRIPFFGTASLWYAAYCVKKIIKRHPNATVIARGPFASYACLCARSARSSTPLIMQARGLLVDEYVYTQNRTKKDRYYTLKLSLYTKLESAVYKAHNNKQIIIEAVSPAMREHLIKTYAIDPHTSTIAYEDIPQPIPQQQRVLWRTTQRKELGIPTDAHLYCYNGSAKPWQCPEVFFTFCRHKIAPNEQAHLLIISQDHELFKQLITKTTLPASRYHVITVEHHEIYQYLAAADTGLIFREATLLNWVSRPTKLLEYQAVGLPILHNTTIAWLIESARNQQPYVPPLAPGHMPMTETANAHDTR